MKQTHINITETQAGNYLYKVSLISRGFGSNMLYMLNNWSNKKVNKLMNHDSKPKGNKFDYNT